MKYYIIAGEASGDLHGSNLMKALFKKDPKADIRFWGGDLMQAVGGKLVVHYKERQIMGFLEVLRHLFKLLKFIRHCKKDIFSFKPLVVVFIDNSGFNLRIAKWAKKQGFKTHYYISPQVWASRAYRVKAIKRSVDALYTILPFEKAFYDTYNYKTHFVGHPLLDSISGRTLVDPKSFRKAHQLSDLPIIALLPGSRKQEIGKILPVMLSVIPRFKDYQFVIAGAPSQDFSFYKTIIGSLKVTFINNKTYDLLSVAHAALVTSGTATLEVALFKVPQVVCYKTSIITYWIAKQIIHLKYISLVNLIMNRRVVAELIQDELNTSTLKTALEAILESKNRVQLMNDYKVLAQQLGGGGASEKTAEMIYGSVSKGAF